MPAISSTSNNGCRVPNIEYVESPFSVKRFLVAIVLAGAITASVQAQSTEEKAVRTAYAKLSLLCGLRPLFSLAIEQTMGHSVDAAAIDKANRDATPVFTLSDFEVGDVSSILSKTWGDYVSYPHIHSNLLDISGSGDSFTEIDKSSHFQASMDAEWSPVKDDMSDADPDMVAASGKPVQPMVEIESRGKYSFSGVDSTYNRYAAFQVNVRFKGKNSGKYKAMFLFGHQDATGKPDIAVIDMITTAGAVHDMAMAPIYPEGLLHSSLREMPVVKQWLAANQQPASICEPGKRDACCTGDRCGFSISDINEDLKQPVSVSISPPVSIER